MSEVTTDLEASLEDLRNAAIAELDGEVPAPAPTSGQPRDDKGRFSSAQTVDDAAANVDDDTDDQPQLYRRVIDIGDGAGPEVFEAESLEELVDKIAEGKKHASQKIREQQKELTTLKQTTPKLDEPTGLSEDEEFILSQELLSHPSKAIKKLFKETTGYSIEEFATVKQRMDAIDQTRAKDEAIHTFLVSHPDFVDGDHNSKVMGLAMKGQSMSSDNLHKAYLDLKESGLLKLKDENANDGQDNSSDNTMRIAEASQSNVPSRTTRRASGISTQNRTQPVVRKTELTEEELAKLPLDKLREMEMQSSRWS
jgi:hypothetical protein